MSVWLNDCPAKTCVRETDPAMPHIAYWRRSSQVMSFTLQEASVCSVSENTYQKRSVPLESSRRVIKSVDTFDVHSSKFIQNLALRKTNLNMDAGVRYRLTLHHMDGANNTTRFQRTRQREFLSESSIDSKMQRNPYTSNTRHRFALFDSR